MRLALAALGVKAGSDVLTPALDWPANLAAIKSLGAQAVLVPVDADTLTINPAAVRARITPGAKALIATHLHGVPADVPALRAACGPNLAIVEDCAQSLGSALDNQTVGLLGDAAVFSFGPRKQIDAGEGGMVLTRDWELQTEVLRLGAHPARQLIGGETNVEFAGFSLRPHPLTAVLLAVRLSAWSHAAARRAAEILREKIIAYEGWQVVGADERRRNAASLLPVVKTVRNAPDLPLTRESGARDLAALQAGSPPVWLAGPGIEA
jgi:dTDP-4-amino-4,6-dideoxygalactose transaminase